MSRRPAIAASRVGVAIGIGVLGLLGAAGCRRQEAPPPPPRVDALETVEVGPPPDVLVDPSRDQQEVRRVEELSGVLPSDYPAGLPLPSGASLVDQGPRWVELLLAQPPVALRPRYLAQLRGAGWQATSDPDGTLRLSRGSVQARARLRADGPSTRLRIDY